MHLPHNAPGPAWLPLTPRGVAAFADASWRRMALVQLLLAAGLAVLAIATVQDTWFAGTRELIQQLPVEAAIRGGRLEWTNAAPERLLESRYLAVAVDPKHEGSLGQEADLSVELGATNVMLSSLFGYATLPYPGDYTLSLRRTDVSAWWGAREPFLVAAVGLGVGLFWLTAWWVLGAAYWMVAWLVGAMAGRDLRPGGALRLALAAQLPGALLFAAALASYRFGWINLLRLTYAVALALAVPWFYLVASALLRPKATRGAGGPNPFTSGGEAGKPAGTRRRDNPFGR